MTSHLGYASGDREGKTASGSTNSRNGSYPKTLATEVGPVTIQAPRGREGSFTPRLVPKCSRRLGGLDDMIISLYAGGMTVRDIGHHLAKTVGTELSHETVSSVTDAVADAVLEWRERPLDEFYPVMYLDAIRVKVRDGGRVVSKAAYFATVSRATPTSFAMLLHDTPCASSTLIRCCTDTGTVIPFLSRETEWFAFNLGN